MKRLDVVEEVVEPPRLGTEIGTQIRRRREAKGYTQDELAERAGMRQANIHRLESGENVPLLTTIDRIARALDARIDVFLVDSEEEVPKAKTG